MKKYEPQMVAGTLMAIAIRLYKTNLSDDGFSEMLQTVLDSEEIKSYFDDEGGHTLMPRSRWINQVQWMFVKRILKLICLQRCCLKRYTMSFQLT